jgi:small subunit ribosomal protein S5
MTVSDENQVVVQGAPAAELPAKAETKPERAEGRGFRGGGFGRGRGRGRRASDAADADGQNKGDELSEKVVYINRSAKVVKGGRRFSFSALVVAGDRKGKVGIGLGKAGEVADAIRKGGEMARASMVSVSLKGNTLPHEVNGTFCGAKVLLRPASPGTGIIAGQTMRAVLENAGVKDVLTKSLGSKNAANVVKATLSALQMLRLKEEVYKARGLAIEPPTPRPAPGSPAPSAPAASTPITA